VECASESDDPYNLDESDDDDDEGEDENGGDEARPTPSATTSPHFDGDVPTVLLDGKNTQSDRREVNRTVLSG